MENHEKEFQDILASQGELVGSVSHDLKGLLNSIDGGIYLVDSGIKNDKKERVTQGFDMVKRNLARIQRTVTNILYFVKDREIDWESIEINHLLGMVTKQLTPYAEHLKVNLMVKETKGAFEGGEYPVSSLLLNLAEFCITACSISKGAPNLEVTLDGKLEENGIVFNFNALGFCIEDDTITRAFGSYYSPKGADRSHLGLFIVNKLVNMLSGKMDIKSSPDDVSTQFTITIPNKKPEHN